MSGTKWTIQLGPDLQVSPAGRAPTQSAGSERSAGGHQLLGRRQH